MENFKKLINEFKLLDHQSKYDKVIVYLDIIRKKETEFLWLYGLVSELGLEITDETLIEIYSNLIYLIEYGQKVKFDTIKQKLKQQSSLIKKHEDIEKGEKNEADNILKNI